MPDTEQDITIITTTDALAEYCGIAARSMYVTIDTEFIRERTYYPKLCLVQIACEEQAVIIDPLAKGMSLAPLYALLDNPDVLKVFHAARQDLEIFFHLMGRIPHPVFDTQVAAMVCGFGESISYDGLVSQLAGTQLDKTSRFTNWEQRPLTQKQLEYALADVVHLRTVYQVLEAQLERNGRVSWIEEEMEVLISPATYDPHPEEMWKRLRVRSKSQKFLVILQAVTAWRERMAQKMDLPRGRVLKDDTLADIAASQPKNVADLHRLRGMNKGLDDVLLETLLQVMKEARAQPKENWPQPPATHPVPVPAAVIELLRVLLKRQCDKQGVAQKLVASREDLELVALGQLEQTPLSHGWRWEVFGRLAHDLLQGKLALALDKNEKSVVLLTADEIVAH